MTATKSGYDAMIKQHSLDGTRLSFQQAMQKDALGTEATAYRCSSSWWRLSSPARMLVFSAFRCLCTLASLPPSVAASYLHSAISACAASAFCRFCMLPSLCAGTCACLKFGMLMSLHADVSASCCSLHAVLCMLPPLHAFILSVWIPL